MYLKLTKEQRQLMIAEIQHFFSYERDEEINEFAAERVLDFVKETLAPYIYNAALSDVKYLVERQFSTLEEEIISLERPIKRI